MSKEKRPSCPACMFFHVLCSCYSILLCIYFFVSFILFADFICCTPRHNKSEKTHRRDKMYFLHDQKVTKVSNKKQNMKHVTNREDFMFWYRINKTNFF
jgi:hypothetical protein